MIPEKPILNRKHQRLYSVDGIDFSSQEELEEYLNESLGVPFDDEEDLLESTTSLSSDAKLVGDNIYLEGPVSIETESGTYKVTFRSVHILPEYYIGDEKERDAVYQVEYEVENMDFSNEYSSGVQLIPSDLQFIDSDGYILESMSIGCEGDWSNAYEIVTPGHKCVIKFTFMIQDETAEYLDLFIDSRNVTIRQYISK